MKKLYAVGCSFTYGDELDHPETQSWPAQLAKMLGMEIVNDATSGGTNQRSQYKILKNLGTADVYVIAWTSYSRFTFYKSDNNFEINFNPNLQNKIYNKEKFYREWGEDLYKYWYNELYAFKLWLQQIIYTQSILKNHDYIMVNAFNNSIDRWVTSPECFIDSVRGLVNFDIMNDNQLFEEYAEIQHYIKMIDFSKFFQWGSFDLYGVCDHFPCGENGHFLESGHHHVANLIYNFYVQNQNTNC